MQDLWKAIAIAAIWLGCSAIVITWLIVASHTHGNTVDFTGLFIMALIATIFIVLEY